MRLFIDYMVNLAPERFLKHGKDTVADDMTYDPVRHCPFNSDCLFRLALAQKRMSNGLVDASDFDDQRNGWSVEQVWKEMHSLYPFHPIPL